MKKIILLFVLFGQNSFAQNDIIFQINHLLNGAENFSTTTKGQNNANTNFTLSRMEYYLSNISIKHDGGQTLVFDDTTILINVYDETNISLGNHGVTNLESVHFYLGVKQSLNHLDPSTYPMEHPLAPKSPSMHWGWTGGYRFFAIEGLGNGQTFELHGVGNEIYEEITVDFTETSVESGTLVIDINAEYNEALRDLDIAGGFSVHGDHNNAEVLTGAYNFKNHIFSANEGNPNSIEDVKEVSNRFHVFPSITNGYVNIGQLEFNSMVIYNALGQFNSKYSNAQDRILIENKGIHFLHFYDKNEKLISINKVIVQ